MRLKPPVHRLPLSIVMALAGSFLLSGCGDSEPDSGVDPTESVLYSQTSRIRGLDPASAGEVSSSMAIARIYEGLLEYDYLVRPYKVKPLLAEAMPEISADGLTYTFKIRKGIYSLLPRRKGSRTRCRGFCLFHQARGGCEECLVRLLGLQ